MQRVCDQRCGIIYEGPQLGTQAEIFNREAVLHMSNHFTHDLERRVLGQGNKNTDLGPNAGLD